MGERRVHIEITADGKQAEQTFDRVAAKAKNFRAVVAGRDGKPLDMSGFTNPFAEMDRSSRRGGGMRNAMLDLHRQMLADAAAFNRSFQGQFLQSFAVIDRHMLDLSRDFQSTYRNIETFNQQHVRSVTAATSAEMRLDRQRFVEVERMKQAEIRTASLATREFQKQEREKLKTAQATARAAAKDYEKELGAGFFSRLGKGASDGFKRAFGVSGGGGAGGGFVGNALSVATGNIISGVITGAVEQVQQGISAGMDFNRLKEATMLGLRRKLGGDAQAGRFFDEVAQFAQVESPLKIPQATGQANRLLALNFKRDEIIPLLRTAGDAAAGMGLVGEEAEQKVISITKALADIKGKQRVNAEEMSRQLQESGVNGWRYIAEELQSQYPKLSRLSEEQAIAVARDMAEHNRLDANAAINAIVRGLQKEFGGTGKDINLNTLVGQEAMTEDNMSVIMGKATESLFRHKLVGQKALNQGLQGGAAERLAGYVSAGTDSALSAVEDGLRALGVSLPKLGAEAFSGAADSVKQTGPKLYEAGAGAAGQLEQGWRDELDQHSPSRVFDKLGFEASFSAVQGFNRGLLQGQGNSRERIDEFVRKAAERFKVDPDLIKAVIKKESNYHSKAVSPMGARGLMQLMPATAASLGVKDIFDPEQNIMGGTKYLAGLLKMFKGDVRLALAAYNAGEGAVLAHLPNRPDVNSYVGGSGRRWTVSEEAAQRAQGIPQNGQTPEYVNTILRDYTRATGGAGSLSVSTQTPVPVAIVKAPDFSGFPGTPFAPEMEQRALGSDTPASGDLRGGVGRFVGAGNQRAFLEWLFQVEKAAAASERTSVQAQSEYALRVKLMAEELQVSSNFVRLAQGHVATLIEAQRAQAAAQAAADGGSFRPGSKLFTPEDARRALAVDWYERETSPIEQQAGIIAQRVAPQALANVKLVAQETKGAFQEVLPLIKASTDEAEKRAKKISGVIAGYFGGALNAAIRRDWQGLFEGILDDAKDFLVRLAKEKVQQKIYNVLSPKASLSADSIASGGGGGGLSLGNAGGVVNAFKAGGFKAGIKSLFGFGGAAASKGAAAGPWVNPAKFAAEFGAAPAMVGVGAGTASGSAAGGGAAAGAGAGASSGGMLALMTNPWTIGIAAAAVGGLLLWKHFSHRDEKALKPVIKSEYALDVKDLKTLTAAKQIGESAFGKGQVKNHLLETVRLDPVKELLTGYAEQTGQTASKLLANKELADASSPANSFIRRIDGGAVPGMTRGFDHVRALLDGGEHVIDSQSVARNGGHAAFDALRAGQADITPRGKTPLARVMAKMRERQQKEQEERGRSASAPTNNRASGSGGDDKSAEMAAALKEVQATQKELAETQKELAGAVREFNSKVQATRPGDVFAAGAKEKPRVAFDAVVTSLEGGHNREKLQKLIGL
ncbi:MAG TPA: lytic transglycosylase domain-containing protein [Pyrinomonadaceae bacterium]